ncbi:MAG TPA: uroporphyrinogen decarboxylase family protein, partial [Thermoleophilia bacterium]|nr:uroporphyrinogen decarboxylase family protein [Thermoleophilia bacterium]
AEAEYKARVDRILAAINLEKPDRVPVRLNMGFWPAKSAGLTAYEAMSDPARAAKAWKDFNLKFQPDASVDPVHNTVPGSMFEALDYRLYAWPGHGVSEQASYQYNEKEWMLPEEYDHLISDPSDYMLRTYLPRTVGALAGFGNLSSLFDFIELPFVSGNVGAWGTPEMAAGLERMAAAAKSLSEWGKVVFPVMGEVQGLGFPGYACCGTKAPFDILGDTLRGTKGVIMDMFRYPDKVLAACERLVQVAVDWPLKRPGILPTPIVFIPLHKGADGFMSDEQFHTFYWPTLRRLLLGLIDQGMIPFLFAEGRYNTRLEAIMDLPKASTIWLFDQSDMARAKQTIGKVACIQGNMPLSLLHAGTKEEVVAHTREIIDMAAEGGGFIFDVGAVADEGNDDNLLTMIQTVREYGVY